MSINADLDDFKHLLDVAGFRKEIFEGLVKVNISDFCKERASLFQGDKDTKTQLYDMGFEKDVANILENKGIDENNVEEWLKNYIYSIICEW